MDALRVDATKFGVLPSKDGENECRPRTEVLKLSLVGGLVAIFYFPTYWECHHPN